MKKILIIYPSMGIGGSTTSLLSILNEIDYTKYSVDLILFKDKGKLFNELPDSVNVLTPAYKSKLPLKVKKRLSLSCWKIGMMHLPSLQRSQLIAQETAKMCRELKEEYDVAIGFLECWPLYYLATKVKAKKKICWIHVNYGEAGFKPEYDRNYLLKIDKIVLVSNSCADNFRICFPEIQERVLMIPNILSDKVIRMRACESEADFNFDQYENRLKFITVCRLDCAHKGLDRAVNAFGEILREKPNMKKKFIWAIVGGGKDYQKIQEMIKGFGLDKNIFLLGEKTNPHIYGKHCDIFLLPSRYEGKPMAVTEAQMLGVVPCVTHYSSACEQIRDGIDGIVMPNDDKAIASMLRKILNGEIDLKKMKENVKNTCYSNLDDMELVIKTIEE